VRQLNGLFLSFLSSFSFFAPNIIPTYKLSYVSLEQQQQQFREILYQFRNSNLFHHFQVEKGGGEFFFFFRQKLTFAC
jgi:hypothetical protein